MRRHLEQVLAHAESQLAAMGEKRPTEVLPLYKKFLKIEEHRLRLKHQAGGGGREVSALRVDLVDILLRHVFAAAVATAGKKTDTEPPFALIALGGYGRGELNPHSDVDVMLLHGSRGRKLSPYIDQIVEQILYLLWDIGFKVGHSTRSIKEAIAQANRDMLTKTAMLESRYLAGNEKLAQTFRDQFRAKCVAGYEREYVEMRMQDQDARHKKFGDSVYMQEPNLKNGCGGLRDYQNLLWMTYFKKAPDHDSPGRQDWLSEADQRHIKQPMIFCSGYGPTCTISPAAPPRLLHLNMQEQIKRLNTGTGGRLRNGRSCVITSNTRATFSASPRGSATVRGRACYHRVRSLFGFSP
jgi:hypothetical protein